jgi:hypothetical protein
MGRIDEQPLPPANDVRPATPRTREKSHTQIETAAFLLSFVFSDIQKHARHDYILTGFCSFPLSMLTSWIAPPHDRNVDQ